LVSSCVRILSTIPAVQPVTIVMLSSMTVNFVDVENPIEFSEHQAEYSSWNAEGWTEHDPNVPHGHLIYAGILHDQN
jgi:hypothetical protein